MNQLDWQIIQLARKGEEEVRRIARDSEPSRKRMMARLILRIADGGKGSGYHNHPGNPGHWGGSRKRGASSGKTRKPPVDSKGRSYQYPKARNVTRKEAGKIISEINTLYHGKYKDMGEFIVHSSYDLKDKAYNYYVEVHGFNEYNICKKLKNRG